MNICSVKILPKFSILLIMNYLITSRQNSNRFLVCQQVLSIHSTPPTVTAEMHSARQSPRKDLTLLLSQSLTVLTELLSQGWTDSGLWAELGWWVCSGQGYTRDMPKQKPHVQINGCI